MVKLTLPNEIINETPADATPVEQNYSYIQQHVNNEQINRDGSVAMTAQLHLVGDPLNPTDAASKGYVDAVLPVGIMLPFGGIVAPAGSWALCNGAVLTTSLYPKLFAVLQYRFGGSGANFNLPDLRGRVPVGLDGSANYNIVGRVGGTLTVPVPQHSHDMPHTHGLGLYTSDEATAHTHGISPTGTITTSSDGAHYHNSAYINHSLPSTGTEGVDRSMNAAPPYPTGYLQAGTDVQGAHTHTYSGNTSVEQNAHTHFVSGNTGSSSAAATANAGTAAVEQAQPYVTVNYVIRVG